MAIAALVGRLGGNLRGWCREAGLAGLTQNRAILSQLLAQDPFRFG